MNAQRQWCLDVAMYRLVVMIVCKVDLEYSTGCSQYPLNIIWKDHAGYVTVHYIYNHLLWQVIQSSVFALCLSKRVSDYIK